MNQAAQLGFDEPELIRLHQAHELATRLVDGLYRTQGVPFLCHLVRAASIIMAETRSIEVILAGMLHAVYFLHYFDGSGRRGPRRSDREFLRRRIGAHAERLVALYAEFPWNEPGVIHGYAEAVREQSAETHELLLMKLANELEDHLDAAPSFVTRADAAPRHARFGAEYVALAAAMGRDALASDLREAFDLCRRTEVSPALSKRRAGSYELRSRLWKANVVERVGAAMRRRKPR
jgi:hypothetical protein